MLQHFQVRGLIEGKDEQKKTHKLVQKTLVELKKREKETYSAQDMSDASRALRCPSHRWMLRRYRGLIV
jgi:hypothetical protein